MRYNQTPTGQTHTPINTFPNRRGPSKSTRKIKGLQFSYTTCFHGMIGFTSRLREPLLFFFLFRFGGLFLLCLFNGNRLGVYMYFERIDSLTRLHCAYYTHN